MLLHVLSLDCLLFAHHECFASSSGPVVAMVWEGKNVVKTGRVMLGATNPADSLPGIHSCLQ